jgi:hypothetical protein
MTAARGGQKGGFPPNCDVQRRETSPSEAVRPTLSHA